LVMVFAYEEEQLIKEGLYPRKEEQAADVENTSPEVASEETIIVVESTDSDAWDVGASSKEIPKESEANESATKKS
jgi:hypothetical protein